MAHELQARPRGLGAQGAAAAQASGPADLVRRSAAALVRRAAPPHRGQAPGRADPSPLSHRAHRRVPGHRSHAVRDLPARVRGRRHATIAHRRSEAGDLCLPRRRCVLVSRGRPRSRAQAHHHALQLALGSGSGPRDRSPLLGRRSVPRGRDPHAARRCPSRRDRAVVHEGRARPRRTPAARVRARAVSESRRQAPRSRRRYRRHRATRRRRHLAPARQRRRHPRRRRRTPGPRRRHRGALPQQRPGAARPERAAGARDPERRVRRRDRVRDGRSQRARPRARGGGRAHAGSTVARCIGDRARRRHGGSTAAHGPEAIGAAPATQAEDGWDHWVDVFRRVARAVERARVRADVPRLARRDRRTGAAARARRRRAADDEPAPPRRAPARARRRRAPRTCGLVALVRRAAQRATCRRSPRRTSSGSSATSEPCSSSPSTAARASSGRSCIARSCGPPRSSMRATRKSSSTTIPRATIAPCSTCARARIPTSACRSRAASTSVAPRACASPTSRSRARAIAASSCGAASRRAQVRARLSAARAERPRACARLRDVGRTIAFDDDATRARAPACEARAWLGSARARRRRRRALARAAAQSPHACTAASRAARSIAAFRTSSFSHMAAAATTAPLFVDFADARADDEGIAPRPRVHDAGAAGRPHLPLAEFPRGIRAGQLLPRPARAPRLHGARRGRAPTRAREAARASATPTRSPTRSGARSSAILATPLDRERLPGYVAAHDPASARLDELEFLCTRRRRHEHAHPRRARAGVPPASRRTAGRLRRARRGARLPAACAAS